MITVSKKIMKKSVLMCGFFLISLFTFANEANYYDYKSVLVGDSKGNIIKQDNVYETRPLASVTKVMTSILTLDKIRSNEISMDDKVTVSRKAASVPYGITLTAGKEYTVEDLLKATIIKSSNNAAYALAEYVSGGNVNSFINSMNDKAREWNLHSLRFCSPHGLPPSYTGSCMDQGNAKDLYGMALKAVEYKEYLNISRNSMDYIDGGEIKVTSTNTLLGKVGGLDGLKTGYHKAAGSNIILTAERRNDRVIVVILGSSKAKNRNAIGAREIDDYFLTAGSRNTAENRKSSNENNNVTITTSTVNKSNTNTAGSTSKNSQNNDESKNVFKDLWNSLTSNGNQQNTSSEKKIEDLGNGKKKVINKNNAIQSIKIDNEKYKLYPSEDIVIIGEAGKKKIQYKITLNKNISSKDKGKIVGYYSADDGINEFTGSLIMK